LATTIPEAVTTIPSGTLRLLLTSISYRAKARKSCGGIRQWFRAARRTPTAGLPRRDDPVQVETLRLMVCPPTWRRWCICGLCGCCIVRAGMGQITGKTPVKPCKRFWSLDGIIFCMGGIKAAVNACERLYYSRAKQKPCTLSRCKAKEKPRQRGRGRNHLFFSSRSAPFFHAALSWQKILAAVAVSMGANHLSGHLEFCTPMGRAGDFFI